MSSPWLASALVGASTGAGIGVGIYFLRKRVPDVAVFLGFVALAALVFGVLALGALVLSSFSQGGDAAIAGVTGMVLGVLGLGVIALGAAAIGVLQRRVLELPLGSRLLTGLIDPLLLGAIAWGFLTLIIQPLHRQRSDASWQREVARREEIKSLAASIPQPYRNMPIELIDEQNRMRRENSRHGLPNIRMVPEDVDAKIRKLSDLQRSTPPAMDMAAYHRIEGIRKGFLGGLAAGWLAAALALPLFMRLTNPIKR